VDEWIPIDSSRRAIPDFLFCRVFEFILR
jgi:hypothetical protein